MGKYLVAIIVIAILVIGGVTISRKHNNNNATNTGTYTQNQPASSNSSTQNTANNNQSTGSIDIKNMMFTPSQITVAKGGTVTWTNHDTIAHTVTADNGNGPNSGNIQPGATYSYTFNQTGSFQYHCSIHPSMRGTIVVK